jgi:ribosomal 30S subunit maturation factor RimM
MPELIECGTILKTHGLKGQLIIQLNKTLQSPAFLCIALKDGNRVPYRIIQLKSHQRHWLVSFEGITDLNTAQSLVKRSLFASSIHVIENTSSSKIGYQCVDVHAGFFGTVQNQYTKGTQMWLEIDPHQRVLPWVEDWISYIDESKKTICFELPDGILNL